MIGYLSGEIIEVNASQILLMIGGVGYVLHVPAHEDYQTLPLKAQKSFFCYTHVREDALEIFGFYTKSEKELFLTLLSVNGVGPKVSLGILSHALRMGVSSFIQAIREGDHQRLTQIQGIGKKTAERIIVELQDTIDKKVSSFTESPSSKRMGYSHEAMLALISLGYKDYEVKSVLEKIAQKVSQKNDIESFTTEQWVREALGALSKHQLSGGRNLSGAL